MNIDYKKAHKILEAHEYAEIEIGTNGYECIYLYSYLDIIRDESIWLKEDGSPPDYITDYMGRNQKVEHIDLDLDRNWLPTK